MKTLRFTKMHGLYNDFMVVDGISQQFEPTELPLSRWADRHGGIGFDQLLIVEESNTAGVDFKYRIFNADGSEVEQCGNGARCFVKFVVEKQLTNKQEIIVETAKGIIVPKLLENGMITVNMGKPKFAPNEIPFHPVVDKESLALTHTLLIGLESVQVSCVNMGNPHAVIIVDDIEHAPVELWGSAIESHDQFPERVNVGFVEIVDSNSIKLRVFERGTGETQACGTGACAAVVAGIRLGLLEDTGDIKVALPGGVLSINWKEGNDVMMTGPAESVFEGEIQY